MPPNRVRVSWLLSGAPVAVECNLLSISCFLIIGCVVLCTLKYVTACVIGVYVSRSTVPLVRWYFRCCVSVRCYVSKVLCRRSCVSYATSVSRHRTRNIPSPSATDQALRAARPLGPSSRLTVALPPHEMFADRLCEYRTKVP